MVSQLYLIKLLVFQSMWHVLGDPRIPGQYRGEEIGGERFEPEHT
jgi:hypothetical protein